MGPQKDRGSSGLVRPGGVQGCAVPWLAYAAAPDCPNAVERQVGSLRE